MATKRAVLTIGSQRGIALVLVLLVILVLSMLGSVFVGGSLMEYQIARNDEEIVQAFYIADGGIQRVLNAMNQDLTPPSSGTIGSGQFTTSVTDAPPPWGQKRIEATGFVPTQASPRAVKRISVLVGRTGPMRFDFAMFGASSVRISGGGTDSYNSSSGAYNALTANSHGNVGTNGGVNLSGSALVKGNAQAGTTVNDSTKVTGTTTNGAAAVPLSDVSCPSGSYTASVPSGPGITYNAATGALTVSGGNNITLTAPGTYYFNTVTLSGGSTLTIGSGGPVQIYIAGQATFSGGSIVNTSALPPNLALWGCGTNTTTWTISGGSGAYYTVYAPHHPITISGGSDIWGAVYGESINNSGGSQVHYDEALGSGGKFGIVRGSWTELTF